MGLPCDKNGREKVGYMKKQKGNNKKNRNHQTNQQKHNLKCKRKVLE